MANDERCRMVETPRGTGRLSLGAVSAVCAIAACILAVGCAPTTHAPIRAKTRSEIAIDRFFDVDIGELFPSVSVLYFSPEGPRWLPLGPEGGGDPNLELSMVLSLKLDSNGLPADGDGSAPMEDYAWIVFDGAQSSMIVHFSGMGFSLGPHHFAGDRFTNARLADRLRTVFERSGMMKGYSGRIFDESLKEAAGKPVPELADPTLAEMELEREERLIRAGRLAYALGTFSRPGYPAEKDVLAKTEAILSAGGDPDEIVEKDYGRTRLHLAAERGHWAVAKRLLLAGAKPDIKDEYGWTPLLLAAEGLNMQIMDLLLIAGADVKAGEDNGPTVMLAVFENDPPPLDLLRTLVLAGATVNVSDRKGMTPLMKVAEAGSVRLVKFLLSKGANAKAKNRYGATALSIAEAEGHKEVAALLRKH